MSDQNPGSSMNPVPGESSAAAMEADAPTKAAVAAGLTSAPDQSVAMAARNAVTAADMPRSSRPGSNDLPGSRRTSSEKPRGSENRHASNARDRGSRKPGPSTRTPGRLARNRGHI